MGEATILMRKGALGDVVLLGAVTGQLEGRVIVATDLRYAEVAERLPGVNRVVAWPARGLSGRRIDLQGGLRGWRVAPMAHHVRKHSIRRRLRLWGVPLAPRPSVPEIYGAALGVVPAVLPWINLPRRSRDTLGLAPGAAWEPKRWSISGLAHVGRSWAGPVVVFGGPGEQALVSSLVEAIPGAIGVCERGFQQTLDWLPRVRVMVAGDTGLLHLAGATGAKVVGLFGPTHPDDGFWVYPGEVVQRALSCRPCTLHRVARCPLEHHDCMALSPADVAAAVARCAG